MVSVWVQIISLFLCQMFSVGGVTPRCSSLQGDDKAVLSSCNFTRCMWEFHALNKIVLWISFCGRCLWMKGALILMIRHGCRLLLIMSEASPVCLSCPYADIYTCITFFCSTVCRLRVYISAFLSTDRNCWVFSIRRYLTSQYKVDWLC